MLRHACLLALSLAAPPSIFAADREADHRAWQHGVDLLRVEGKLLVVWGSPGNPPKANPGGDWEHDVYYAWLDADSKEAAPQVLVSRPEAQEPPSTTINANGTILMTTEDGDGGINQRAGLWDSALKPVRAYPVTIRRGGHSGHAAAMGNRFLVAYSEGWVKGGGFLDRGTGKDVLARIVENDGTLRAEVKLTGRGSRHRDDWPLVAGSDRNWLVVWKRYPERSLQAALINESGRVAARRNIAEGLPVGYAYDVAFSPKTGVYAIAGARGEEGFMALVDLKGDIVATRDGMPPIASESRVVIGSDGADAIAIYPVRPRGVAVVRISAGGLELVKVVDHPYAWDYSGTAGAFVGFGRVLFATLSTTGLKLIHVDLGLR